jgi:hypothetical protein
MTIQEFEQEIKQISPRFTIKPNPNRPGLNNIYFDGRNFDLPVCPDDVREDIDESYRYDFPNGYTARMWAKPEMIERLKAFLEQFNSGKLNEIYNEK